jgi:endonuclease YncB( thermonuclease family)
MDGASKTPAPAKELGAFDAPKPADVGQAAAGLRPAKPQTDAVKIDIGTGQTKPAGKPIEIPKGVQWQQPVTALKATGSNTTGAAGKAVVTYVGDGDTIGTKNPSLNCRIDGIDAPETAKPRYGKAGQPYGEEAKKTLQDLVLNKEVTIKVTRPTTGTGNYGRDLCQIEVHGKDVSAEMIKAGAAWLYTTFGAATPSNLKAAQGEAITNKRGVWGTENPIPPWQFRRMENYGK